MKVLIIHQYFNTPKTGGPCRSYYLAKGLSSNGIEVELITAHNQTNTDSCTDLGFKVHYLPVFYDNNLGYIARIFAFVKFARMSLAKALQINNVDLCYAISTPLTIGWVARKLKAIRGIPYYFEVGDLWPEAPIQMGIIKYGWLKTRAKHFERSIYKAADHIVALSPGIRDSILTTSPGSSVSVIPNMSDCKFFQMEAKDKRLEAKYGVEGKTTITYFGAAGKANHLEYFIEAARYAKKQAPSLHFLMAAKGSELKRLKKLALQYNLYNLSFLAYGNRDHLKQILNVTDAVYVSYADVPVLATGSPNKYFDGLAAGKIMLVNFKGWLKTITQQHHLGFYVDPACPNQVSDVMKSLIDQPEALSKSQKQARVIAETFFSRELALNNLVRIIVKKPRPLVKESEAYTLTV